MTSAKTKATNRSSAKTSSKKTSDETDGSIDDPNAVHDVYTEKDLDPAYDETIADDIAFDYDGPSGDPGDQAQPKKSKK